MYNPEMKFSRKGYGRIFVEEEEDVQVLEDIMQEIDPYEFEGFYPTGNFVGGGPQNRLTTAFSEDNFKSVYIGKFDDMDMIEVLKRAWARGIHCFVVFGKCNEFDDW